MWHMNEQLIAILGRTPRNLKWLRGNQFHNGVCIQLVDTSMQSTTLAIFRRGVTVQMFILSFRMF